MKKIFYFFIVLTIMFFQGCLEVQPKTPGQIINASSDKYITKVFLENLKDSKYDINFYKNLIQIKEYISGEKGYTDPSVGAAVNYYKNNIDSSNDEIAKLYIKAANERGNTVKMYKNFVNEKIADELPVHIGIEYEYSSYRDDLDNAFIEYDINGRIKSALIRSHIFPESLGDILHYRNSIIVFGNLAQRIENEIPNDVFEKGYITSFSSKVNYKDNSISNKTKVSFKHNDNSNLSMKSILVDKYNKEHGTNFKNMKELMKYMMIHNKN